LVRAGETGGVLEESLLRVADQLEKEDAPRRQIKSAIVYPAVVLSFAPLVLLGLVTFIVPVFVGVFEQFGGDLPAMTKVTVGLSNAIKGYWWAFIAGVAGAVWLFRRWKRSERGRGQWDAFRLRIPMKIGDIVQKVALARWSRTLAALSAPASRCCRPSTSPAGRPATAWSRTQWRTSSSRSGAAARSPSRSSGPTSSRAWSPTWSASGKRQAHSTPWSPRSRTPTRTRSTPPSRP
jgi:Type II secretion system (T2SS), protein F